MKGNVVFDKVSFSYPARPDLEILSDFSLSVKNGKTVALVGPSGCGKSTAVQLLTRFYDASKGSVSIDGHEVRSLNIAWLRQHIGVVSQEPVLFATTIAENIRYGRDGVSDEDIVQACKEANAHNFIMQFPDKYNTMVGERGAQMSGGQKQRIAIARALVRNPKILLLDDATSALDMESEAIVQEALDKACQGRTTIVIAHRLSTIQNADLIIGMSNGRVVERGNHEELMEKKGVYYQLVMTQLAARDKKPDEKQNDDLDGFLESSDSESEEIRSHRGSRPIGSIIRTNRAFSRTASSRGSNRHRSGTVAADDEWTADDEEKAAEKLPPPPLRRLLKLNAPEWKYILVACFAAIFTGGVHPTFAVIFSEIMGLFALPEDEAKSEAIKYALLLFGLGVIDAVANTIMQFFFAKAGEELTLRIRGMAFQSILRQEISWFDDRSNQVGALTARLAVDASVVKGAAGQQIGIIIQSACNIGVAIIISFIFGWKLTCVVISFLPLMVASGMIQGRLMHGYSKGDKSAVEEGGKIAVEAIDNIRTVVALGKEGVFEQRYDDHFKAVLKQGHMKSHIFGAFYALGCSIIFFTYAAAFSYGAQLVEDGEMAYKNVVRVFAAITFGGQALGRASTLAPDISKGKIAAAKLFAIFDRKPAIDSSSTAGVKADTCAGDITFKNVRFRYPARPEVQVLKGLNIHIQSGKTLALVGSSGCGKSTTIQLLQRFYDPEIGKVTVDQRDCREYNLQYLRSQMGLVSQEPVLFEGSIADNIAYGDNTRVVPMNEIIEAAKEANIHKFVTELPDGYSTNVGDRGAMFSRGQKQRITIARALVRKPKILLLDEATSALDTDSELVVQEALDAARIGRTSIVIAHRLSTIQNADVIAVIHQGVVVEQGTHAQLMVKEGFYYKLQKAQQRKKKSSNDQQL